MNDFAVVACLTSVPTIAMMLGAIIVVWKEPGPRLTAVLQQFAAGIVCCAISTEFSPVLLEADTRTTELYLYKLGGYVFGVILMLGVEHFGKYFQEKMEKEALKKSSLSPDAPPSPTNAFGGTFPTRCVCELQYLMYLGKCLHMQSISLTTTTLWAM